MRTRNNGLLRYAVRARRGFAVFGLVLLAASTAPCAMALDLAHSCAHCPPQVTGAADSHHGHHGERQPNDCDSLQGQCGDGDEINSDSRPAQPKVKDAPELPAIIVATSGESGILRATEHFPALDPPLRRGSTPPIHLLNCVFLD